VTVLRADGSTSGNERAPNANFLYGRAVYLVTAAEAQANGLTNGTTPGSIGWRYTAGPGVTANGTLVVYLQNTSDTNNTKSTIWASAIAGMTVVHNAPTTLPDTTAPFDIPFAGGSPFTYTGGALYVAFDWQWSGPTTASTVVACSSTLSSGLLGAQSNASVPTTIAASNVRPETRLTPATATIFNDAVPAGVRYAYAIVAVDTAGNAYIVGRTVMKLDPTGGSLIYSNPLGGVNGADIAVDAAGDAFVTGATRSPRFRTTTGALQRHRAPGRRRPSTPFVSELNPAGSALDYSTYLGDDGDFASALAVDPAGHAYVTGGTISGALPISPGAFQRHPRESDGYAAFVTALDPTGPPTAGLYISAIERRGDRIRLRGTLDPTADGELLASTGRGQFRRAARLRLDKGEFLVTTTSSGTTKTLKVVLDFQGHVPWTSESVCRKLRIGPRRPRRWTEIGYRDCG